MSANNNNEVKTAFFRGRRPRVFGHQGARGVVPDNTLISFRQALADGADVLELDCHLTKDGVPVVIHDPRVDKLTDGVGAISALTLAEIKALDAGYRWTADGGKTFPFRGKGITIPTLEEFLNEFTDVPLNVEVKNDAEDMLNIDQSIETVFAMLERYGRLSDVAVCGFDHKHLKKLRAARKGVATNFSTREVAILSVLAKLRLEFLFKLFAPKGPVVFEVPERRGGYQVLTPRFVDAAHKLGYEVYVWTVNRSEDIERIYALGVDGIMSDFPGRCTRALGR